MQYVYDIGKNDCTHMDGHVEVFILSLLLYSHGWTCGGIYFIIIIVLTWMDIWRCLFYHYYCTHMDGHVEVFILSLLLSQLQRITGY